MAVLYVGLIERRKYDTSSLGDRLALLQLALHCLYRMYRQNSVSFLELEQNIVRHLSSEYT